MRGKGKIWWGSSTKKRPRKGKKEMRLSTMGKKGGAGVWKPTGKNRGVNTQGTKLQGKQTCEKKRPEHVQVGGGFFFAKTRRKRKRGLKRRRFGKKMAGILKKGARRMGGNLPQKLCRA